MPSVQVDGIDFCGNTVAGRCEVTSATKNSFALREFGGIVEMAVIGRWSEEASRAFEFENVDRLLLSPSDGYSEPTLDFLRGLPLRELILSDGRVTDLEPVYALSQTLTSLDLTTDIAVTVDFARLPKLEAASGSWEQLGGSIQSATSMQRLAVGDYPHEDLVPLAASALLTELHVANDPKLRSLGGLAAFPKLRKLQIRGASKLHDISELRGRQSLEIIELDSCRKISKLDGLAGCTSVSFLNLGDCGKLESAAPLRELTQIEELYLYESTSFVDGDLTPIAELPNLRDLRLVNRRHYRPKVADIMRRIDPNYVEFTKRQLLRMLTDNAGRHTDDEADGTT